MIDITNKSTCCGCSACAEICSNNCIAMKEDVEGFLYPEIEKDNCVECGNCESVCPIRNRILESMFVQDGYIVQNNNERILRESTAGGAFTAIARYVIKREGIVFGVALSDELMAHHIWVDNEKDLSKFRNSKYVQSYIRRGIYKQVEFFLKQGKLVCFSGTPCQVEGLKHYLSKNYQNLITVDVVCRAVPSPMVFRKYLAMQNKKLDSPVCDVRFRDKHFGYKYSTMNITTDNNLGAYHQGVESDPWLRAFFSGVCNRPSCYTCQFKKRYRVSDFTIWDCFNVGRFSKELDNDKGATRILVHTDKGREIYKEISADLRYVNVDPERLIEGTMEMTKSVRRNGLRTEFMRDAAVMDGVELFDKYFPNTVKVKIEHSLRMICYKLGIYSVVKKAYVRITHKY